MKSDLTERYIYAVTKRLPRKTRQDVADELQTLISDMLEERCGEVVPGEKDVRVVLTELGTPTELYEKYAGGEKKCLIGQPYYTTYQYVLKIVLACVAFGMTLAAFISSLEQAGEVSMAASVGKGLGMLASGLVFAFAVVTALFAFFYHKDIPLEGQGSGLDNLPPVPVKKETISKAESVFGIVLNVIFLVVFLGFPQIIMLVREGQTIPLFNVPALRELWYFIVSFGILGILQEIVRLLDGRYTRRVLAVTAVTDILTGILAVWWLSKENIMNPALPGELTLLFGEGEQFITKIFGNFQYVFLGVILFALALDLGEAAVKWYQLEVRGNGRKAGGGLGE